MWTEQIRRRAAINETNLDFKTNVLFYQLSWLSRFKKIQNLMPRALLPTSELNFERKNVEKFSRVDKETRWASLHEKRVATNWLKTDLNNKLSNVLRDES